MLNETEIQKAVAELPAHLQVPARLNLLVEMALEELRTANQGPLVSRELSLAITNIEQGSHWLSVLIARLDDGQQTMAR